jgi:translocation and assembly module TamB
MSKWQRTIGWVLASLLALLLIAIAAGYFILKSNGFRQYALQRIVNETQLATGAKTEIGGLDFNLSTLTAHLYNITMHGTENLNQPPLLHADKLTVSVKIVSALRRQVSLSELLIDHPIVYLQVAKDGKNNLPVPPPSQSGSHTNVFDLAIRHAQITQGEISYNDRKAPLEADLHELMTDIRFATFARRYDGNILYQDGHMRYAKYRPVPHNLSLTFSATPDRFDLQSATMNVGLSYVTLQGRVSNYENPVADGTYAIRVEARDLNQLSPASAPAGEVSLTGKLHYQFVANEPFVRGILVDGRAMSEMLSATAAGHRVTLQKLKGSYQLARGDLRLTDLSLETLGGRITADSMIAHLDSAPDVVIRASLSGISLKSLQRVLGAQQPGGATVAGTIGGRAAISWKGSIDNLQANSDLSLQARAASRSNPSSTEIPVNGAIHASYNARNQTYELRNTSVTIPSASMTAQGSVSQNSNLQIQVVANDLHQAVLLASSFGTSHSIPAISGSASVTAAIHGSVKKPAISAQLKGQNLQVEGSEWPSVQLSLLANPSQITVQRGSLIDAQHGQVNFNGSVVLQDWAYDSSNSIKANLDVQHMRIAELLQLANQSYPVAGDLSAKLHFDGSQLNPNGSGSAQIANMQAYGEPIQLLTASFQARDGSIDSTLNATSQAGAIDVNLSYIPKTRSYNIRFNAPSVVLQKLKTVQEENIDLSGTVAASVSGAGTLDDPQLDATIQLPNLQLRQNSIGDVKAELHVQQHAADLKFDSVVAQVPIHAHGHIALNGNYDTDAAIDTGTIPLDVLAATYVSGAPQDFQGQAELHATLKGPLKDKSRIEAHVSIPALKASYQSLEIGIEQPIRLDYSNSVVTLQPAELKGTDSSLRVQGRIPIGGTSSPTLAAQGSMDLRVLKILNPDLNSSGAVELNLHATGSATHPTVQGQVQLKDAAFNTESLPVSIAKLNGTLDVDNNRLQFTTMTGALGGGEFSVGGSIAYQPSVQFNLALQAKSVRLLYPDGLRSLLEANLAYSGTPKNSTLNGNVTVSRLSFTPDFDLSKFADQFSTTSAISQPGFADTVRLAIAVRSQDLNATSSQISLAGSALLQVGGTAADPVITGRTTLTSGELFYRNVRYQLRNGAITFDNPTETHPVMNVSATTTIEQYNLTLSLRGPLDKLTTSYTSDPPLATADVINLVARGKTTQESAAQSQSTDSMIASQAASEVSGGLQKLAGISSLQIDPTIGGNGQSPSTQIAIQQRVTKNLLVTFSTDVAQPGGEIIQGEYQVNKRWSVSAERDQLGGLSVDGRYHKRF